MQELRPHPRATDARARPAVPPYLIYFGIPPFVAAFVLTVLDPFAGLTLVVCLTVIVITVNIVMRFSRKREFPGTKG